VLRRGGERLVHGERLLDEGQRVVGLGHIELLFDGGALARVGPQAIDAESASQLRQPGLDRGIVPELVQMLVRTREDFLEDVLGVGLRQPEGLDRDRVHVAREALHQLAPGLGVAGPAAGDELAVTQRRSHQVEL
jgi:hypothetical protein